MNSGRVLTFDFGAAHLDLSVVDASGEGPPTILESLRTEDLGGRDFDEAMYRLCERKTLGSGRAVVIDGSMEEYRQRRLADAERLRVELSTREAVDLSPPDASRLPVADTKPVTRVEFERECEPLIYSMLDAVKELLKQARVAPTELQHVLLAGGMCHTPMVVKALRNFLCSSTAAGGEGEPKGPTFKRHPRPAFLQHAIAVGAALRVGKSQAPTGDRSSRSGGEKVSTLPRSSAQATAMHSSQRMGSSSTSGESQPRQAALHHGIYFHRAPALDPNGPNIPSLKRLTSTAVSV